MPGLERLDLLKPEDRAMLVVFCTTWSRYVDAGRAYAPTVLTMTNLDSSHTSAHPCV